MNGTTSAARGTILVAHPSPDLYGSDRVLLESVSALVDAGYRVVVALPGAGPLAPALEERGAEVEYVGSPVLRKAALRPAGLVRLMRTTMCSLPAMLRVLRAERPRLVFVNTITIPLWIAMGRLVGARVVCHVHEAEDSLRPALRRLLYFPLLFAHELVVNSRFSLDVLARSWPVLGRRGRLVYNGVPGPEASVPPRRSLTGQVRLLFIGRLSPRKGPQVALRALERLQREEPGRYRLSLVGAVFPGYEWFERELREFVTDRGLSAQVTFFGFDPDIWGHLAACDIVLVPSTVDEPFGNTAVEAMLALRPLVVSATSGLREAAAGYSTARLVHADDSDAIITGVRELVSSWESVLEGTASDRELAIARHAPAVYQRSLVAVIGGVLRRAPDRVADPVSPYGEQLRAALRGTPADGDAPFGVVVVNFGSSALLVENFAPDLQEAAGARVVVVDNFSTAAERASIRRLCEARDWALVEPDDNLGFGDGVNAGVLRAAELGCRTFVTVNPDAVAAPATLAELAGVARVRRALVSPLVFSADGRPAFRGSTVSLRTGRIRGGWVQGDDDPEWKNWLSGACLAFSAEVFAELGGFAGDFFLYWEDVDLSRRAAEAGIELVLRDDLRISHEEGGTHAVLDPRAKSPVYYFYNTRNRLLFGGRQAEPRDRVRWLLATPAESLQIWLRGGRRQLFTQPAGAVAALRGTVVGLIRFFR